MRLSNFFIHFYNDFAMLFSEIQWIGMPKRFVPRFRETILCWWLLTQFNKRNITVTVPQICFYWFMMIGSKFKGKLSSKQNVHAIHDLKRTSALLAKKTSIMLPSSNVIIHKKKSAEAKFIYLSICKLKFVTRYKTNGTS